MSERPADRLSNYEVDGLCNTAAHTVPGGRRLLLLAREAQASRKLIADLRALHRPMWVSEQAKAAGKEPWVCELCGTGDGSWPCESVLLIDGAGL